MKRFASLLLWTFRHGFINLIHRLSNEELFDIYVLEEFGVGNSSISDGETNASYPSLCGQAARDKEIFRKFRRSRAMVETLDHVTIEQGNSYISEISKLSEWSEKFNASLLRLDNVGKPRKFRFKPYGTFSPTVLRYLKVYLELEKEFGSLNKLNIAEIGIGFGGQASIICLLSEPKSYTLYDIPPVLDLARKLIQEVDVRGDFTFINGRNPEPSSPDLVISNYAFSELSREYQNVYLRNVVLNTPRGYITWNSLSEKNLGGYSLAELIRLIPNSQIRPEKPNTSEGNVIVIWGV